MLSSIAGWVEDKATGLLRSGIQAGGTLAGNAVGGVGSVIESAGHSAGQTVSGSIGGVGNYINGYGEGIKRSMSADGPVSSAPKKTAVKSSTSNVRKSEGTPKRISSFGNATKASPSTQHKADASPRSAAPAKAPQGRATNNVQGKAAAAKSIANSATTQTKQRAQATPDGKVRISPESRPGYRRPATTTTVSARKHDAKDPLGIGANFADISKTRPTTPQRSTMTKSAPSRKPTRKPTAADPLALGEDIGKIGKRK